MPKLIINPRIPNRIRIIDYRKFAHATPEKSRELSQWYENGDLIILSRYRFRAGCEVFNQILFPNQTRAKKLMLHLDAVEHGEPVRDWDWGVVRELMQKQNTEFADLENAVRDANKEILKICGELFPWYNYKKRFCIYNLSEMLAHNMHFDSPQHAGDFTQLRAFVNLDDFPRIWRVGGQLEDVVNDRYKSADLQATIGGHPREFTRQTTLSAFGDRYESGSHNFPMHSVAFQPGEVWFLNPNMMAHEIVYGRRLLDGVFLFDASDLLDKQRYYPNIVEKLHKENIGNFRFLFKSKILKIKNLIKEMWINTIKIKDRN